MPIRVSFLKNKIALVTKIRDENTFRSVVELIKSYDGKFSETTKVWLIKVRDWDTLCPRLEDIDDLFYEDGFQDHLDNFIAESSTLKHFDDAISRKSLKVQPIKGKAPFDNYQFEDITNAFNTNRYAFFNDPGTGKTYEYMTVVELQRKHRNAGKIVFLTSNSGVYNMKKEFSKFTDIPQDLITVGGVKNRRPFDDLTKEVIIMSYRSMLLVYDEYHKTRTGGMSKTHTKFTRAVDKWLGGRDGIFILDECHNIANPGSQQTDAVFHAKDLFEYVYIGTGTPADKLEKYYSQLKVLDSSLIHGMSKTDWVNKYFNVGNSFSSTAISSIKDEMIVPLQNIIKSVSSRRLAEEVLDLPENNFKKIVVDFTPQHRKIYEQVVTGLLKEMQEEGAIESNKVQNLFPYLIMSVDSPEELVKHFGEKITEPGLIEAINKFNFLKDHAKVEVVKDIVEDFSDEKIILWTSHPSVGFKFAEFFKKKNPFLINGEVAIPKQFKGDGDKFKLSIVEEFQNDPKRHIGIFSTQMMNSSLNIVKCNRQVLIDNSYNYVELDQLLKRIHRLGQKKDVTTYIPLIDRSLDMLRRATLEDKGFVDKFFLSEKFLTKQTLSRMFNFSLEDV